MERERNSRPGKRGRKKVCMFCVDRAEKTIIKISLSLENA